MAVSKAVVPVLHGKAAEEFKKQLKESRMKPYSQKEREATDKAIRSILDERKR